MPSDSRAALLQKTYELAAEYLDGLEQRPAGARAEFRTLLEEAGGPMPDCGEDSLVVIEHMEKSFDAGLSASAGPRYFGFVTGGSIPAALAADWLTSVWDQNGFNFATSPAAAAANGNGHAGEDTITRQVDDAAPLALYVYKTMTDPFTGRVTFFKVISGKMKCDAGLMNYTRGDSEALSHLYIMQGRKTVGSIVLAP